MKAFKLTEEQEADLEERHRLAKDTTECDRIKAVLLHSLKFATTPGAEVFCLWAEKI